MQKKSAQLAEIAELKFRPLKKNLHHSFKALTNSIASDKLPGQKTLDQFQDEVLLMTSYPGFGDEFYGSFKEACKELFTFYKANDIGGFKEQIARIHTLKKQCHKSFR